MKIKIFVGIALVIFILAVGSILALGFIQKSIKAPVGNVIQAPDTSAIVDTKKNTQQSITGIANSSTAVSNTSATQNTKQVVIRPVRRVVTRAS